MTRTVIAVSALAVLLAAPSAEAQKPSESKVAKDVKSLQQTCAFLSRRLTALEHNRVQLDPAVLEKFQRIDATAGTFLIMLENVEPYLDGHKVSILVGNPGFSTYSGIAFKLEWGPREPDTNDANRWMRWYQALGSRAKGFSFPQDLSPGAWSRVEVVTTGSENSLGYMAIYDLQIDSIKLTNAPPRPGK